jgi:hypothetical protein
MDGWEVRKYRAAMIRFDGRTWRIGGKTVGADRTIRYELVPWQPGEQDIPGLEIEYTPDYVALRDYTAATGRRRSNVTAGLRIVSPLIGFLSARTKARLEAVYGLDPVAATFQSVFLQFLITIGCFVLATIGMMAMAGAAVYRLSGGPGIPAVLLVAIGVAVGIDGAVRYGRILNEERPPPGFYEWLFRRRRDADKP